MKRRKFLQIASGAAACSVARFTQTRAQMTGFQGRSSLSLNGTWDFQMDPKNEGLTVMPGAELGKWFTADAAYSHRIEVPGCWQAQGFGPPNRHLRHDYQGKGLVPANRKSSCRLDGKANLASHRRRQQLCRCIRESPLGGRGGGLSDALRVRCHRAHFGRGPKTSSSAESTAADRLPSACSISWVAGAGLYREVFLEERSDPVIDDLFVQPDVKNRRARTQVVLKRSTAGPAWKGELLVKIQPEKGGSVCARARADWILERVTGK